MNFDQPEKSEGSPSPEPTIDEIATELVRVFEDHPHTFHVDIARLDIEKSKKETALRSEKVLGAVAKTAINYLQFPGMYSYSKFAPKLDSLGIGQNLILQRPDVIDAIRALRKTQLSMIDFPISEYVK